MSTVAVEQSTGYFEATLEGVPDLVMLENVATRLRGEQAGAYKCKANACALTHIEEAIMWLRQTPQERARWEAEYTPPKV